MNPAWAWFRIVRPPIVFISVLGALVGALNATWPLDRSVTGLELLLTALGAGLLGAGLMVHNDYTDLESDRVNRPGKPIPSGAISPSTARWSGIAMMGAAVALSFGIGYPNGGAWWDLFGGLNIPCGLLAVMVFLVGVIYNERGKYEGLWGHVMVAFGVGVIPYWGALAVEPSDPWVMLPLALAIFVMEIGREIMVCAGDIVGDIEAGFRTTPVRMGRERSVWFSLLFYLGFVPLYPISYFGWLGFPAIFGDLYLAGGVVFFIILIVGWVDCLAAVRSGDDRKAWAAFERSVRTGSRAGVILFQFILLAEAFI
jgi:geranylgeranylglycerol-phosphate geranylgeranyltransferase